MSDTLLVPSAQAARSNSAALLSDLAERVRAEHTAVVRASNDVLNHVLAAGRVLIEAQSIVPKGQWADWVSRTCEVSYRTARRYMQLTRAYETSGHSVASDLLGLSLRGLMRALAPSKSSRRGHERRPSSTPSTQEKLSSLTWANASPAERARFIGAIGWQSLAEAVPSDWLPVIEKWLQERLPKEPITIDGYVIPDDLSIPTFLRREPPPSSADSIREPPNTEATAVTENQGEEVEEEDEFERFERRLQERARKVKWIESTTEIAPAINNAFRNLQELASEVRDIVENTPDNLRGTERIQTLEYSADGLENLETPKVPDTLGKVPVEYSLPKRRRFSRAARANDAGTVLEACAHTLGSIPDGDEHHADAQALMGDLQVAI